VKETSYWGRWNTHIVLNTYFLVCCGFWDNQSYVSDVPELLDYASISDSSINNGLSNTHEDYRSLIYTYMYVYIYIYIYIYCAVSVPIYLLCKKRQKNNSFKMHLSAFLLKVIALFVIEHYMLTFMNWICRGNNGANVPEFLRCTYISKLVNFPVRESKWYW